MRLFFYALAAVTLFFGTPGQSEEPSFCQNARKYYCTPQQLEITEYTILVHLEETSVEVDALHVDQGGIYFTENMLRCPNCRRPINPKRICEHSNCLARN